MNHRFSIFSTFLLIFFFIITISSCRKGENDPLISLLSRKARITGGWNFYSGSYSYDSPTVYRLDVEYDGETATETVDGIIINTFEYKVKFVINKDYSFERTTTGDGFSKVEKGSWFFNKKSKDLDLRNKEAIILSIKSIVAAGVTTTYSGAKADEFLIIDRLKSKEIIFKGVNTYTSTQTDTESYEYKYLKI